MATAVAPLPQNLSTVPAVAPARTRSKASRMVPAMIGACVVIFALTITLSTVMLPTPLVANLGFAFFCTFWLGGGFGLIAAGSAIADHLHD